MKKIFLMSLGTMLLGTTMAQKPNAHLKATLPGLEAGKWVYLNTLSTNNRDSVQSHKDGFEYHTYIGEGDGDIYFISIGKGYQDGNNTLTYLQKGTIKMVGKEGNFNGIRYSGDNYAKDIQDLIDQSVNSGLREKRVKTYSAYQEKAAEKDTNAMASIRAEMDALEEQQTAMDKAWVATHKNSPAVAYAAFVSLRNNMSLSELEALLNTLGPKAKNNLPIKKIENSIRVEKLVGIGQPAIEFTQTDTAGKAVSLKDFRGKYVLIDFWASWCVPCRIENPHVVAAFEQFKNKGFTVLGVSFDHPGAGDKWRAAIRADKLDWTQVSDLQGWNNAAGKQYDIRSIPSNFLIDPQGIIVAKNLRGDKLEEKLAELLGEPELAANQFILKAGFKDAPSNSSVRLWYMNANKEYVQDSIPLFYGVMVLKGNVANQQMARFQLIDENGTREQGEFFLEPGVITMAGDWTQPETIAFSGTASNEELAKYKAITAPIQAGLRPLSDKYNVINEKYISDKRAGKSEAELAGYITEMNAIRDEMEPGRKEMATANIDYFKTNPNSPVTLQMLKFYVSGMRLDDLDQIYASMDENLKESLDGKELLREITNLRSGSPGSMAPEIAGIDINGKPLKLSDYRGKVVLVDFWASWCVPCRKGNPHLLKVYEKYKKKGFEIIGVSDDDSNPEAWKKAVAKDQIGVWKHVLRGLKRSADGGYDKSEDKSESYGIHTLPTKILIDKTGKIVARFGSEEEPFDKAMEELFGF